MNLIEHSRARLMTRISIAGPLVFETAFHLGGGRLDFSTTDSPVVRDGDGLPIIPGSSIKGAVRATIERMAPNLDLSACGIFDKSVRCLTPREKDESPCKEYHELLEALNRDIDENLSTKINRVLRGSGKTVNDAPDSVITEDVLLFLLDHALCDVCKAFGAPFLGSAIYFHDATIDPERWLGLTQIRDGVGIDRDSGRAVDGLLYDYEIVPPQTTFNFSMTIESNHPTVLGLAALGLHELLHGNIPLGGIKSRGLGRCKLSKKAKAKTVALNNRESLLAYLRDGAVQEQDIEVFIKENLKHILPKEDEHVQASAQ